MQAALISMINLELGTSTLEDSCRRVEEALDVGDTYGSAKHLAHIKEKIDGAKT